MDDTADAGTLDRRLARTPLAVVGLSSLFPGSTDVEGFWNGIVDRVDAIRDIPDWHWDVEDHYSPDRTAPDKTYARRGGFIDPVPFHPIDFGIPPSQLDVTDVLQLLSLVVTRDLLRDAGTDAGDWYDAARTGVVLGVTGANQLTQPLSARLQTPAIMRAARSVGLSEADAAEIARRFRAGFAPWEENSFPGMLGNVVAGRVANRFDLGGMNMTVDAACASSLGALRAAAAELVDHRADTMITGGCDAENTVFMYLCFSKTPAFSPTGDVRPFDASSDGTLIGEGIGMLALRRLEDAERDGNRIYSVIRGIGSASDGRYKSIYAPRASGQQLALRRAYEDADCAPASVSVVEAHGTGTAVGDATELSALSEVLAEAGAAEGSIAIGSVKSQIGHTKAAAGAAGLIKLSLALQHRIVPPTIKVETPASAFAGSPLHVSTQPRPWFRSPDRPVRRAGLSAFGFGGTNFHVVLEEHPASRTIGNALDRSVVRLWAAETPPELASALEDGAAPLESGTAIDPGWARIALVAETSDAADAMRPGAARRIRAESDAAWSDPRGSHYRPTALDGARVGLLFSGQGSQHVDAAISAVLREPVLMDALEDAYATAGLEELAAVAYPPPATDDAGRSARTARLRETQNAQPAIGALSAAHHRLLTGLGLAPSAFAGHSFGELTALWAAGSLDDASFLHLARVRGEAMAAAANGHGDVGAMAAVLADRATTDALVAATDGLVLCNVNSPRQHVVGGPREAVDRVVRLAEERGVRVVELPVAAAFHTPAVAGAVDAFGGAVRAAGVGVPSRGPVHANTPGGSYGSDVAANAELLAEQLAQPVDFESCVRRMHDDGVRVFVECGPGNVLARLVAEILGDADDVLVVAADAGDPATSQHVLATTIARLAVAGALERWQSAGLRERPVPRGGTGPAVMLTGVNHVSAARADGYERLLAEPYELTSRAPRSPDGVASDPVAVAASRAVAVPPHAAPPAPAPVGRVADEVPLPVRAPIPITTHRTRSEPENMSVIHTTPSRHLELAREQLHVHADFLSGQQDVSRALLTMLEGDHDHVPVDGIREIVAQCIAVGDAHVQVNRMISAGGADETSDGSGRVSRAGRARVSGTVGGGGGGRSARHEDALVERPARRSIALRDDHVAPGSEVARVGAAPVAEAIVHAEPADAGAHAAARVTAPPVVREEPTTAVPAAHGAAPDAVADSAVADAAAPAADVDVDALVRDVVAEKTGYSADILELDMGIEADLGIDSIKRVEILGAIGERFPGRAPFSPEEVAELRTLGDIVGALRTSGSGTSRERRAAAAADDEEAAPGIRRSVVRWRRIPGPDLPASRPRRRVVLVDLADAPLTAPLHRALEGAGHEVRVATADDLGGLDGDMVLVAGPGRDATDALVTALVAVQAFVRAHASRTADVEEAPRLLAVGLLDGRDPDSADGIAAAGLAGLVRTARIEHPGIRSRAVLMEDGGGLDPDAAAAALVDELDDAADGLDTVRWSAGERSTVRVEPDDADAEDAVTDAALPAARARWDDLDVDDAVLVTGGAQGITALCMRELAAANPRPVYVLAGRTPSEEPAWATGLDSPAELRDAAATVLRDAGKRPTPRAVGALADPVLAGRRITEQLAALERAGVRAHYIRVDLTDADATRQALAPFAARITAVVHGAGAIADKLIADKAPEDARRVIATKLRSLENVLAGLGGSSRLRHVVLFSSVAGLFGNRGQGDYAMANAVLDRWAEGLAAHLPAAHVVSIDWGAWDGGMVSDAVRALFRARGYALVAPGTGARMLVEQTTAPHVDQRQVLIGPAEPLSGDPIPARRTRSALRLNDLFASELVRAHALDGTRILPLAAGACLLAAAGGRHTGRLAAELRDVRVSAGVGDADAGPFVVLLDDATAEGPGDARLRAMLASAGDGPGGRDRPRFAATLVAASPALPGGTPAGPPASASPVRPLDPYASGLLFHADALQAVTGVQRDDDAVTVHALNPGVARPLATEAGAMDVVALDVAMQAALVAAHEAAGMVALPSAVGSLRWTGVTVAGDALRIRATGIRATADRTRMDLVVTAVRAGREHVVATLDDVEVTRRPAAVTAANAADALVTAGAS
ncbi:Phenolphthiocerol synthesis polyketide synthase type I Pks15/1 [Clavibacter michiganensis]|uniref:Phenolphthiocerol synthesis polyketide synthase type I Pks15/1 n=1 Tax=Clavibacter michiganensis TaxID=28447 RepID=A0A251YFT0_9MICO|nr:type I polyketide synthase [Clavibacter michiganensis]OUE22979.1 Phenolphthiocerol synthesis polyketide synthase type I Pks15/1 [Clavibacter michiganensis]